MQAGCQAHRDVARSGYLLTELRNAPQLLFKVDNCHLLCKASQIQGLFHCTIGSTHHIHIFSGIGGAISGSIHAHALAGKLLLAGNTQFPRRAAVCQNNTLGLINTPVRGHRLNLSRQRHMHSLGLNDLHPGLERLLFHPSRKCSSSFLLLNGSIVRNSGNFANDAAHLGFFQNQCTLSTTNCINACADTRRACSDDDYIVHSHMLPFHVTVKNKPTARNHSMICFRGLHRGYKSGHSPNILPENMLRCAQIIDVYTLIIAPIIDKIKCRIVIQL